MSHSLPILGISMGDPAGVGPEIIVKAFASPQVHAMCRPLVVGDAGVMRQAAKLIGSTQSINAVEQVRDARYQPGVIDVLDLKLLNIADLKLGQVSPLAGDAAFKTVKSLIDLANKREVAGTVTCPIHKEALFQAGYKFPGHTEIFAHFTETRDFTMMLAAGKFRVVHVSTHVSLRQACDAVTRERVLKVIQLGYDACRKLGIANPKIGVTGLNPHASDGGLFGTEERDHIIPAINDAKTLGIIVEGPQPADTFFPKAVAGVYDICVAMYHDQGHVPVKLMGFKFDASSMTWTSVNGINVSLGLPIIRTSVDHGTAFDQAGKGTASEKSLLDAIEYAAKLAEPQ